MSSFVERIRFESGITLLNLLKELSEMSGSKLRVAKSHLSYLPQNPLVPKAIYNVLVSLIRSGAFMGLIPRLRQITLGERGGVVLEFPENHFFIILASQSHAPPRLQSLGAGLLVPRGSPIYSAVVRYCKELGYKLPNVPYLFIGIFSAGGPAYPLIIPVQLSDVEALRRGELSKLVTPARGSALALGPGEYNRLVERIRQVDTAFAEVLSQLSLVIPMVMAVLDFFTSRE